MRVLHVVPAVAPRYGGPSGAALSMVRALIDAGAEAMLATTDADGRNSLAVATGTPSLFEGTPTVFFHRLPGESLKPSLSLSRWLARNVSSWDLVHVHSVFSHPSLAAGVAARRSGVPYVLRPLGQLDKWSLAQHRFRKQAFLSLGGRRLVSGAAALHWTDPSERERAEMVRQARRSFVIPLGVDGELFLGDSEVPRGRTILFLSRLHPKKNVEGLISAFLATGGPSTGWELVVAGKGEPEYEAKLKSLAAARPGGEGIRFAGWLCGKEKERMLSEAAFLALPSRQENFGIAVAEALACGTPVVVSRDVALAREIDRVGAGWVAAGDADALRRALEDAMRSSDERLRRGSAARRLARERFGWAAVAQQLLREYESLLGSTGGGL